MTAVEWVGALAAIVAVVLLGTFGLLTTIFVAARLMAYGWRSGWHQFEQDRERKGRVRDGKV